MRTENRPKLEQDFKDLPLEQKISSLFRMEAATLEETFAYVVDSTRRAAEKAGAALSDLSARIETEVKRASTGACAEDKTAGAATAAAKGPKAGKKPPKGKSSPSSKN
jgi:hypothetical protein